MLASLSEELLLGLAILTFLLMRRTIDEALALAEIEARRAKGTLRRTPNHTVAREIRADPREQDKGSGVARLVVNDMIAFVARKSHRISCVV